MRTPSLTALPAEPIESALGTARDLALVARDVARDKGIELLDSEVAHELRRRGHDVLAAARGDLAPARTRRRRALTMLIFAAGSAAGVAAALIARRLATRVPPTYDGALYGDPAAEFPRKDGVVDLTSVADSEGLTDTTVEDVAALGDGSAQPAPARRRG